MVRKHITMIGLSKERVSSTWMNSLIDRVHNVLQINRVQIKMNIEEIL